MIWLKENRFLSGFLGVMLLGILVLGYLLWSARSRFAEISAQYQDQADTLSRLHSSPIYPNAKNLTLIEAQRKEHQQAVATLQKNLATNEIPIEPITEVQFQDRLREAVTRVTAKMKEKAITFDEKFYMGFAPYQAQPPRPEAAPALGRQLKAIEQIMMLLIDNGVRSLDKLEREPLPEENDNYRAPEKGEKGSKELIARHPIEIGFSAEQASFANILNGIVTSKTQFYIPRRIDIKNEKEKAPVRGETVAAASVATPVIAAPAPAPPPPRTPARAGAPRTPSGTAAAPAAPPVPQVSYIVGNEKLIVAMRVEIVDFADLPSAK